MKYKIILFIFSFINFSFFSYSQGINNKYETAKEYINNADYEDAINILNELVKLDPTNYNYFLDLGIAHYSLKNIDISVENLKRSLEYNNKCDECYYQLAKIYFDNQDLNKAEEIIKNGLVANNDSAKLYYLRGLIYQQKGQKDNAVFDFTKAMSIEPKNLTFLMARANQYIQNSDFHFAYSDISNAIEIDPDNSQYFYYRAFILMNLNIMEEALADIEKAIEIKNSVPDYYNLKFSIHSGRKEFDKAQESVLRSIELNPDDYLTYLNLGDMYFQIGEFDDYCKCYQNAIQRIPEELKNERENIQTNYAKFCNKNQIPYYYVRSLGEYNNLNYDKSIAITDEGLKISEYSPLLHNIKGSALLAKKEYDLSLNEFEKSIEFKNLLPNEIINSYSIPISNSNANTIAKSYIIKSNFGIAICLLNGHKYDESIKYINEAIFNAEALDAFSGIEYLYHVKSMAFLGKNDLKSAYSEMDKALIKNPKNSMSSLNIAILKLFEASDYSINNLRFEYLEEINSPRMILPELKLSGNNSSVLLDESWKLCNKVIEQEPKNPIAFLLKAKICQLKNDPDACSYAKEAKDYGLVNSYEELNIKCD